MLVHATRTFDGRQFLDDPVTLHVQGDRVVGLDAGLPASQSEVVDLPEGWLLAPGFVDVHCHGGGGASFSDGGDGIEQVLATHRAAGTTSSMASTVTESLGDLAARVESLAPFVASGDLLGVHLEGPWLSPDHRGAHDPGLLRAPGLQEVQQLVGAGDVVRMVTVAPELPGGIEAVRELAGRGIVAAVGHTDATYEQTRAALDAGATAATHLFNAMRPIHHREPGPVTAVLEDQRVWIELIADGVHLAPAVLRSALRIAGERAVLVTDAMAAAGQPDGDYRLGSLAVRVTEGVARLVDGGAIAGSTLTMAVAVRHAIEAAGVEPAAVLRAATSAPAAMVEADEVGVLRAGALADAVVLDDAWSVRGVLRRGQWVVRPEG